MMKSVHLSRLLGVLVSVLFYMPLAAQNIIVDTEQGVLLGNVGVSGGSANTNLQAGGFAAWKHEQAPISMIMTEDVGVTRYGHVATPQNNMFQVAGDSKAVFVLTGDNTAGGIRFQLPLGWRFTYYKIVVKNNADTGMPTASFTNSYDRSSVYFGETDQNYTYTTSEEGGVQKLSTNAAASNVFARVSHSNTDMGNNLYFKLSSSTADGFARSGGKVGATISYIELGFTTYGKLTEKVVPIARLDGARAFVQAKVNSGRQDFGTLTQVSINNGNDNRLAFNSSTTNRTYGNYEAVVTLYQSSTTPFNPIDDNKFTLQTGAGKPGTWIETTTSGNYDGAGISYQLGTSRSYWIEAPVELQGNGRADGQDRLRVAYRLTGVTLYSHGVANNTTQAYLFPAGETDVYWSYKDNAGNNEGVARYTLQKVTTNSSLTNIPHVRTEPLWYTDTEGRVYTVANGRNVYLARPAQGGEQFVMTENYDAAIKFKKEDLADSKTAFYEGNSNSRYYIGTGMTFAGPRRNATDSDVAKLIYKGEKNLPVNLIVDTSKERGAVSDTLKLQRDTKVMKEYTGLNNDAIEFYVTGGSRDKAYLTYAVEFEPLNPFVSQATLQISAEGENPKNVTLETGNFTLGEDGQNIALSDAFWLKQCTFKITDIKSKYAAADYPENFKGKGNSNYFAVKSPYYNSFKTTILSDEAAQGIKPYSLYRRRNYPTVPASLWSQESRGLYKLAVSEFTEEPFGYNNVKTLKALAPGDNGSFLEFQFPIQSADQDDRYLIDDYFKTLSFTPSTKVNEQNSKANNKTYAESGFTYYLITGDETRNNFSVRFNAEHRAYAFYKVHFKLTNNMTSDFKLVKHDVYQNAFGADPTAKSYYYGASVQLNDNTQGKKSITTTDLKEKLEDFQAPQVGSSGENVRIEPSKLLFLSVDPENIDAVVEDAQTPWSNIRAMLAPNAMIYLPKGNVSNEDNMASLEGGSSTDDRERIYRAANNIVLTDQEPFYARYPMNVDAANSVNYTRKKTANNFTATKASIFLPFALHLTDGVYTNPDDNCTFTVYKMARNGAINKDRYYSGGQAGTDYYTGQFVQQSSTTKPNVGYLIKVDDNYRPAEGISFTIAQAGGKIVPFEAYNSDNGTNENEATPRWTGRIVEQENGQPVQYTGNMIGDVGFALQSEGTYSGYQPQHYFYYGNNRFLNSDAKNRDAKVNVRPFRMGYWIQGDIYFGAEAAAKWFDPIFSDRDETTDILLPEAASADGMLTVRCMNGVMGIASHADQAVSIHNLQGQRMGQLQMRAGDYEEIALPAGVYIVNGKKYINQ